MLKVALVIAVDLIRQAGFGGLAPDAVRFSSQPSLGGPAQVVEAYLTPGAAEAQVRVVQAVGDPRTGWTVTGDGAYAIPAERYRRLADAFDMALASKPDPLIVCADGPGHLAERSKDGRLTSMSGGCEPDNPNTRLAAEVANFVRERAAP